jgi:chromosomal replication initiation ATPase DnaA
MHTSVNKAFYMHPYFFAGCANIDPTANSNRSIAQKIIKAVCKHQGISEEQINTRTRKKEIVYARHLAIYIIRQNTKMGLKDIGMQFGDLMFDHTTIIHSINTLNNWISTEEDVKQTVEQLRIKTQHLKRYTPID